jgi:hypothetical protein
LMVEIKLNKHNKKMIFIEKTNCINALTDFHIDDTCIIHKIKMKRDHTLRGILDETCKRMGKFKFFNWHIYKNNCQYFIKHLVSIINEDFKFKCFKSKKKCKKMHDKIFYHTFIIHVYYSLLFSYNFFQKYIVNVREHAMNLLDALKMKAFAPAQRQQ